jgi:hypothetical protein
MSRTTSACTAYVNIRQHTSAYVSIRQRTLRTTSACSAAYVSIRQRTYSIRQSFSLWRITSTAAPPLCQCLLEDVRADLRNICTHALKEAVFKNTKKAGLSSIKPLLSTLLRLNEAIY